MQERRDGDGASLRSFGFDALGVGMECECSPRRHRRDLEESEWIRIAERDGEQKRAERQEIPRDIASVSKRRAKRRASTRSGSGDGDAAARGGSCDCDFE